MSKDYKELRKCCFKRAKRIVVKVGSNVLTENAGLNIKAIRRLSTQICGLIDKGREIIIVSSGAVAAGMKQIGLDKRPVEIPKKQAAAAVGQSHLVMEYERAFEFFDKKVAQILLTSDDLSHRRRYLNARNTLHTLLEWKVVPIINENDTVVVEEIKFGDNDNLSAMIAILMEADFLINITDIKGLYDKDPRIHKDAELIPVISSINKEIESFADGIPGTVGTGGMLTKIKAARKVISAGIPMIIAGERPDILNDLFAGKKEGTFFVPKKEKMASRKCWIAFTLKPRGILKIDEGAARAVVKKGKSLLSIGISHVDGNFKIGEPVSFETNDGVQLGVGLVNYKASDLRKIIGFRTDQIESRLGCCPYDEVIHRNNMVISDKN
ncbi:glutamate 5-kinase [Candidatus Magnetomoraceae bacterium gMMP-15]